MVSALAASPRASVPSVPHLQTLVTLNVPPMLNERFPYDIEISEAADAIFDAWHISSPIAQHRLTRDAWIEGSGVANILEKR
jgi:hypothetical protein